MTNPESIILAIAADTAQIRRTIRRMRWRGRVRSAWVHCWPLLALAAMLAAVAIFDPTAAGQILRAALAPYNHPWP